MAPALITVNDYTNENHDAEIITIDTLFVILSLLAVVARLASRRMTRVPLAADDRLLIVAWLMALAESAIGSWGTQAAGYGRHISSVTNEQKGVFEKVFFVTTFLQPTTLALTKVSVLILLHRIFITRTFRITIWILGSVVVTWWAAMFLANALICVPAGLPWSRGAPSYSGRKRFLGVVGPIPWVLTDFAILIAPLPMIKQLHLSKSRRIGLAALFLISGLTCIVSIIRFQTLFNPLDDITWDIVDHANWSVIEVNVTIICAAAIASKPVFMLPERLVSKVRAQWSQYEGSYPGSTQLALHSLRSSRNTRIDEWANAKATDPVLSKAIFYTTSSDSELV